MLHALPVGYALDGVKDIRDPRGMVARQFGVDMHVVTADATVARNLMLVVERCHLNVEAMAANRYVAGLSVLTDDEADLGAAVVEMGAGSTTHRDLFRRALRCMLQDLHSAGTTSRRRMRRGRMHCGCRANQTLYGTVLTGGSDAS